MAALKNEVKSFIVQALACFDTPSQVVEAVKNEYGLVVTRQQVETHDPTKAAGKGLLARHHARAAGTSPATSSLL
ncbi:hypothetical protein AO265_35290 [Pseudomonas sp. ABAC61]|nr:hypothetical protein AO265_35290 [Pseudomonas sp. ABAC61]